MACVALLWMCMLCCCGAAAPPVGLRTDDEFYADDGPLPTLAPTEPPPLRGTISSTELAALWALYHATNGLHWLWKPAIEYGLVWDFAATVPQPCLEAIQ